MAAKNAHGTTRNIYSTVCDFRRRPGQDVKVAAVNVGDANALDVRVQVAVGPNATFEVADFSQATTIHEAAGVAVGDVDWYTLAAASAVHTHYRVQAKASVADYPTDYAAYVQTGSLQSPE